MKMPKPTIHALLLACLVAAPAAAQQKAFDWVRDTD